ncbi:MAG: hypothetical protein HOA57_02500 [Candidatus Magasanikbacteria bacterium]|jgi:hypothetical protein|nr:hypothetical protein [Candidatus Magasanikbacteria bacterium]MBT4314905.1 hypothetical protein [Candidatus Magasanikbacteria bacterium]MBT4546861.1 hypothetical protein [Candidatus Magasanikbacteria bacterium]MBT6819225.1 hypothetical protein [Candidatus Magasanikbacteria bacterium]
MNKLRVLCSIIAILLGVVMFIYAGIDDSPGGQLLGVLTGIAGVGGLVKSIKKTAY